MSKIEDLLVSLINIPSETTHEAEILNFIFSHLKSLKGVSVRKQEVGGDRFNIIARKGDSKKWLVAHVDTVPGHFPAKVTKLKISGRGACDNKQSVAACMVLLEELPAINALFTVGEEADFIGARTAQRERVCEGAELVMVQEPTDFKVITGQCGVISFFLRAKGVQKHSSLDGGVSAIDILIKELARLKRFKWHGFNVGIIEGGIAENVVPGSAWAKISVRPRTERDHSAILKVLRANKNIEVDKHILPYRSNLGYEERIARHFSEMFFFPNSIQFGAGSIHHAHTTDESISRKDLNLLPMKLGDMLGARRS